MKFLIPLFLSLGCLTAQAQNFAVVSQNKIMQATPGLVESQQQLDSLTQVYKQDIAKRQEQWQSKVQTLVSNYPDLQGEVTPEQLKTTLSDNDFSKYELFVQENELIAQAAKNYEVQLQNLYAQNIQPKLNTINDAIAAYAKKNKLDAVYILEQMQGAFAYLKADKNITEVIIGEMSEK